MYKLSEAAAHDIEQLLDQSILDFGLLQTGGLLPRLDPLPDTAGRQPGNGK
jgi:hypothetical protein